MNESRHGRAVAACHALAKATALRTVAAVACNLVAQRNYVGALTYLLGARDALIELRYQDDAEALRVCREAIKALREA